MESIPTDMRGDMPSYVPSSAVHTHNNADTHVHFFGEHAFREAP